MHGQCIDYHFAYHVVEHNCYRYHIGIVCLCHAILFSVYACVFTCMSVILLCVCVYVHEMGSSKKWGQKTATQIPHFYGKINH